MSCARNSADSCGGRAREWLCGATHRSHSSRRTALTAHKVQWSGVMVACGQWPAPTAHVPNNAGRRSMTPTAVLRPSFVRRDFNKRLAAGEVAIGAESSAAQRREPSGTDCKAISKARRRDGRTRVRSGAERQIGAISSALERLSRQSSLSFSSLLVYSILLYSCRRVSFECVRTRSALQ